MRHLPVLSANIYTRFRVIRTKNVRASAAGDFLAAGFTLPEMKRSISFDLCLLLARLSCDPLGRMRFTSRMIVVAYVFREKIALLSAEESSDELEQHLSFKHTKHPPVAIPPHYNRSQPIPTFPFISTSSLFRKSPR